MIRWKKIVLGLVFGAFLGGSLQPALAAAAAEEPLPAYYDIRRSVPTDRHSPILHSSPVPGSLPRVKFKNSWGNRSLCKSETCAGGGRQATGGN